MHYLATIGCDRDENGLFCVDGSIVAGFGGDEFVVDGNAVYYTDKKPCNLAAGLNSTSYGVRVMVI